MVGTLRAKPITQSYAMIAWSCAGLALPRRNCRSSC